MDDPRMSEHFGLSEAAPNAIGTTTYALGGSRTENVTPHEQPGGEGPSRAPAVVGSSPSKPCHPLC